MIDRATVLNNLMSFNQNKRYLEIGVQEGITFREIAADHKVAVDPVFYFDTAGYAARSTDRVDFHECTSDYYFENLCNPRQIFDLSFIDGLHTFDQTLRDLMNVMNHSEASSIIVIDDVIPTSYPASLPGHADMAALNEALGTGDPAWMGDVYRLVFFIQNYLPAYSYATVQENHGQTILWRGARALPANAMSVEAVSRASYADSMIRRDAFNLTPFADILSLIGESRQQRTAV